MTRAIALAASILSVLCLPVAGAADAAKGKAHFEVCAACHGPNGAGSVDLKAPHIAGLPVWYVERQLKNFKAGIRGADPRDIPGTQMRPMAMTLPDDAAVADVAAYVATLKAPPPGATLEGDAGKGKAAYATCGACHAADGSGNEALKAPPLATLPDWYIVAQLQAYKSGLRGAHKDDALGAQMRSMAMTLPDEAAIRDVAVYIGTLAN